MVNHNLLAKIMVIHMSQQDVQCDGYNKEKKESVVNTDTNAYINTHILKQPVLIQPVLIQSVLKQPIIDNIKKDTIKIKEINRSKMKPEKNCWCYNKNSKDMRCCGLCYTFCYVTNKDDQCYMCPETFELYYTSGYFVTTCGYGHSGEDCEDCIPTTMCLPLKLPMFFTCLLGSIFNNCINNCRDTDANYLC